jgi:hypothetical protein
LQESPTEAYSACPFCLTKITETQLKDDKIKEPQLEDIKPEKIQEETVLSKEKPIKNKEKPGSCQYHLGYLSEREKNQQIPDECMMCKDIVECMLRKMRT